MRRLFWVFPAVVLPTAFAAGPTTDTDVVTSAGDAFGIILGPESIGLYGPGSVRGFSPISAGNVRIDGLYFDQQGSMIDRLATDTRIRVGLSATSFPWPAPSGIVDYTLREPKDTPRLTSIIYTGPYHSQDIDLDGSTESLDGRFGIAAGGAYHSDEYNPGQTAHTVSWGILPKWRPSSNVTIRTFWGRQASTDAKPQATIYPIPGQAPPPISPHYYGPSWANSDSDSEHYGMLLDARISTGWSVRLGLFHSTLDLPKTYFDLYLNTTSYGIGDHDLVVEPAQHYGSSSGELQLSYHAHSGAWRQEILLGIRGRSIKANYGGAESFDFGVGPVEHSEFSRPSGYAFGPTTSDRIHEYSAGVTYSLEWLERVRFTAGLRHDSYTNDVVDPTVGSSNTSLQPWLYNTSVAFLPTKTLTLFGALTRGLEDSGVAPMDAINRGEVLPATRSSQEEIGAKYAPSSSLSFLAGAFEIDKSYFALDEHGQYDNLGQERHRGLEFSFTGTPTPELRVVAGALFMTPEVLPGSVPGEIIGKLPIGQSHRIAQVSLDCSPTGLPGISLDGVLSYSGSRVASVDNRTLIPEFVSLDLGGRYQFDLEQHSATLRVQIPDVTNTLNWSIANDGGLLRWPGRRVWAYLIINL